MVKMILGMGHTNPQEFVSVEDLQTDVFPITHPIQAYISNSPTRQLESTTPVTRRADGLPHLLLHPSGIAYSYLCSPSS